MGLFATISGCDVMCFANNQYVKLVSSYLNITLKCVVQIVPDCVVWLCCCQPVYPTLIYSCLH